MAIEIVSHISMRSVKLTWPQVIARMGSRLIAGLLLLPPRLSLPPSLGDNGDLTATINAAVAKSFGLASATIGAFSDPNARPKRAKLLVAATDRIHGRSVWFPDAFPLADALVASSAIPALFPWRTMRVAGDRKVLVDGSVVINQPLSRLALHERCGTILACAVGYAGGKLPRPTNLLDNAWQSATLMSHQSSKLEEDYVRVKMGGHGVVHHIHPDVSNPPTTFDFTPDDVRRIVDQACRLTEKWLDQHRQKVEQQSRQQPMLPQVAGEPLSWLAEQWPDDLQP